LLEGGRGGAGEPFAAFPPLAGAGEADRLGAMTPSLAGALGQKALVDFDANASRTRASPSYI
jgi:hypothetical protein